MQSQNTLTSSSKSEWCHLGNGGADSLFVTVVRAKRAGTEGGDTRKGFRNASFMEGVPEGFPEEHCGKFPKD